MIPRKQINKYKKRTGGFFIVRLYGGYSRFVERDILLDIIKKGHLKPTSYIKKCYRLKKQEMLCFSSSHHKMMFPHIGMSIPEYHKQFYSEVIIQKPYAYAKIIS